MRLRCIPTAVVAAILASALLAGPSTAQDGAAAPAADVPDRRGDGWAPTPTVGPAAGGFEDEFVQYPITVNGDYIPVMGPFCMGGDPAAVLWYAPGPAPDSLWTIDETDDGLEIQSTPVTINGTYIPVVGSFDGDLCLDILWYAPGPAPDSIWYANGDGTWDPRPLTINGTYEPVVTFIESTTDDVGSCDPCHDVFWYSTTEGAEQIWLGAPNRSFVPTAAPQVSYSGYRVAAWRDGLVFHRPGAGADWLWWGITAWEPAPDLSVPITINGSYELHEFGIALLMYAPGPATDRALTHANELGTLSVLDGTINGTYRMDTPVHGSFWPMIVFHGPGTAPDSIWILEDG